MMKHIVMSVILLIGASCNAAESSTTIAAARAAISALATHHPLATQSTERVCIALHNGDNGINTHFNRLYLDPYSGRTLGNHLDNDRPCIFVRVKRRSTSTSTKTRATIRDGYGFHAHFAQEREAHPHHPIVGDVRYYLMAKEPDGTIAGIFLGTEKDAYATKASALRTILAVRNSIAARTAAFRVYLDAGACDMAAQLYECTLASEHLLERQARWELLIALSSKYHFIGQEEQGKKYGLQAAEVFVDTTVTEKPGMPSRLFPNLAFSPGCFLGY
jgi:hypothetical protein